MKKFLFISIFSIFISNINAQWTTITIPNTSTNISTLTADTDTVYAGLEGEGIFKSTDLGTSWTDISTNLGNKFINNIQPGPGMMLFVSTSDGPYYTYDQNNYTNATSTGLSNTDISLFYVGGENDNNDFIVGTKGGGFYYGAEIDGPWTAANNGLSGDALEINSFAGYSDDETYYILGTNAGVYFSNNEFSSWADGNAGLSGDQLKVTGVSQLANFSIITTESGAYYSLDYGLNWEVIFADTKFNQLLAYPGAGGGVNVFLFGEVCYYTPDLQNWTQFDTPGEVICGTATSEDVFIATTNTKDGGSLYKQPLNWILTSMENNQELSSQFRMEQNYPNPFENSTIVRLYLPKNQIVEFDIFDIYGRKVDNISAGYLQSGKQSIKINTAGLKAGVYTLRANGEFGSASIKMIKK